MKNPLIAVFRPSHLGGVFTWTVADYEAKLIEGGLTTDGARKWTGPIVLSLTSSSLRCTCDPLGPSLITATAR